MPRRCTRSLQDLPQIIPPRRADLSSTCCSKSSIRELFHGADPRCRAGFATASGSGASRSNRIRAPYVGDHSPRPGQTNDPIGAPISLVIAETLGSYTIINGQTILLRPVDGDPVDAWVSFAHDGILTLTPKHDLEPDTSYALFVPAGGIEAAAKAHRVALNLSAADFDDLLVYLRSLDGRDDDGLIRPRGQLFSDGFEAP